jgi:hypothetical protein
VNASVLFLSTLAIVFVETLRVGPKGRLDRGRVKIHLLTVVGSHFDLLPHMLTHYRDCGLESLIVNLQLESYDDPSYKEVTTVCQNFGATIFSVYVGPWLQNVNTFLYSQAREMYPNDWFVIADLDEFQIYPKPIPKFLEEADRCGFEYVEGCVIDRVAEGGRLPAIRNDISIWEQFPLAGMLTYRIARAAIQKVVAVKGNQQLSGGQHLALSGRGYPRDRGFVPVHHFKWTSGLTHRLARRVAFFKETRQPYSEESSRLLTHFDKHGGNVDIYDSELLIARCARDYPHWPTVREQMLAVLAAIEPAQTDKTPR